LAVAYAAPQTLTLAQLEQIINSINAINNNTVNNNINSNANRFLPPQPVNNTDNVVTNTNNNAATDTNTVNNNAALSNLQLDEQLGIVDTNNFNPNQNIPNALYTYDYQSLFGSFRRK
jgi:hypothetical protein